MKQQKMGEDVALAEFERMCSLARVDTDESTMDDESRTKWRELKGDLVKLIRTGAIVVDETGAPTCAGLKFRAPTGATFIALETYGEGKNMSNMAAAMCEMTGSDKGTFAKLHGRDFQDCSKIATLFLG
jgi:hypothetical protein